MAIKDLIFLKQRKGATPLCGQVWTEVLYAPASFRQVAYLGGQFLAVGNTSDYPPDSVAYTSADASTWVPHTVSAVVGASEWVSDIAYNGSIYAAVGEGFDPANPGVYGVVNTSTDGAIWSSSAGISESLTGIAYGNGTFVAVGASATAMRSTNGTTWTATSGANDCWDVAFTGSLFVAVGGSGKIVSSPDGITWTTRPNNGQDNLVVAFGGSRYVISTFDGLFSSANLTSWTPALDLSGSPFDSFPRRDIYYDGNKFIGVSGDLVSMSTNGINWCSATVPGATDLAGVSSGAGKLVLTSYTDEKIFTSPN